MRPSSARLMQLPNGSWVLPSAILSVEAVSNLRPYIDGDGQRHDARVAIGTRNGTMNISMPTYAAACDLRDQLAQATNRARDAFISPPAAFSVPAATGLYAGAPT